VLVAAASDFNHVGIGVGAAVAGTAGVAPGVNVSVVELTTKALIGTEDSGSPSGLPIDASGVTIDARDDVAVIATAKEKFLVVAATWPCSPRTSPR
jgi:hypothetical protein